jgi:TonB family protein
MLYRIKMKTLLIISILALGWTQLNGQTDSTLTTEEWVGLVVVESMPEYAGGIEALQKYLNSNAIYTAQARTAEVSGTVYATFLVEENGNIANPKILRSLHPDLDSISLSLIEDMPNWIPAIQKGQPVACQFNLPIEFNLNEKRDGDTRPEPSKYWSKKGKKKFYALCTTDFGKSENECDCWYDFVIWNYNDDFMTDLDFEIIFDRQKCK